MVKSCLSLTGRHHNVTTQCMLGLFTTHNCSRLCRHYHLPPNKPFRMDTFSLGLAVGWQWRKPIFVCSMLGIHDHNQLLPFHPQTERKIKMCIITLSFSKARKCPLNRGTPFVSTKMKKKKETKEWRARLRLENCRRKNRCNHNERHLHKFSRHYSYYYFRFVFFFY